MYTLLGPSINIMYLDINKTSDHKTMQVHIPSWVIKVIHASVTSHLDKCNALHYSLPNKQISNLQRLQNTAARNVTLFRKSCSITPILKQIHWLPIS